MISLIKNIIAWVLHNCMTLIVILVVLLLGQIVRTNYQEFKQNATDFEAVTKVFQGSGNVIAELKEKFTEQTNTYLRSIDLPVGKRSKTLESVKGYIGGLEKEREELLKDPEKTLEKVLKGRPVLDALEDALRRDVKIMLLNQALKHLNLLKLRLEPEDEIRKKFESREKFRREILVPENDKNENEIAQLEKDHPTLIHVRMSPPYNEYHRLLNRKAELAEKFDHVFKEMQKLQKRLADFSSLGSLGKFVVENDAFNDIQTQLSKRINDLKKIIDGSWFEKIKKPVKEQLPIALVILLGIILTPILIKVVFYFVFAPLAALLPPIRLLPETSGELSLETGNPAVSRSVVVDAGHELLVHSDFLQSSSDRGCKDTSWFLNKKIPFTSLASGMVALTRIRTDSPETFVISATKNSFSEIGILSIPEGAALVMQPHNLVGIIQPKAAPVSITCHWRLKSLHAWLTLQLRYLAFHGPAQLIVQGCRGVRIEKADGGRSINQAATIGFSANLAYSTRRCETFFAYFLGKRELLNDNFSGEKGFYVYQEMPYFDKKSGFPKRSLEGMTDSLLKVFGI